MLSSDQKSIGEDGGLVIANGNDQIRPAFISFGAVVKNKHALA